MFTVWIAATPVLLASLFVPPPGDREYLVSWHGRFILFVPTVWVVIHLIAGEPTGIVLTTLSIIAALVTLPYTLYIMVIIVSPDLVNLRNPRLISATRAIVLMICSAAYVVGRYNELFLTCADLVVSGNDTPPRCKS